MLTIQQALARHQAGDPAAAVPVYRQFLAANPNHGEVHHLLGVALFQVGELDEALRHLEAAVRGAPDNPDWLANLGLVRFHAGDLAGARAACERALAVNPQDADAHNNLGLALCQLGDLPGAVSHFRLALDLGGPNPQVLHNLGAALHTRGDLAEARAVLEDANRRADGQPDTLASLAAVHYDLGDAEAAFRACWDAVRLDPFHTDAHDCFKNLKWEQGREAEMHDTYRWACETVPDHPATHLQYGRALVADGRFDRAEPVFRRVLTLDPAAARGHSGLGSALSGLGRHDAALVAHARAADLAPDDAEILEAQGEALLRARRFAEAVAPLSIAHRNNPRRSAVLGWLTVAMTEAGDAGVDAFVDYEGDVTTREITPPDGFAEIAAFNEALHRELAERHKDRPPPIAQTMTGGTQIPGNLFENATGHVAELRDAVSAAVRTYVAGLRRDPGHPFLRFANADFRFTGAWSTILQGAGYDASHIHNDGWLSGVYYVKVPDLPEDRWAAGEGCLQFGAPPDFYISERNVTRRVIRPRPGLLVLFPSYLWHGVQPFKQPGLRHAVSFDLI